MTSIFFNPVGDETFGRIGYEPGKGPILPRVTVVTEAAISAGMILQERHNRQKWTVMHRKMQEYLLALRLPPSQLEMVRNFASVLSRRPPDPLGRGHGEGDIERGNGAGLVARAALSILADVRTESPADIWAQFHLVARDPGALLPGQRERVASRLARFVTEHLTGVSTSSRPAPRKAIKARAAARHVVAAGAVACSREGDRA